MFTVDTHCDTLYMRACQPEMTPCVTPEHLREGNVTVQVCTLWAGPKDPLEDPYSKVMREWAMLPQLTEAGIRLIDKPSDAKDGEHCVLLSMEGGETLGKSLELLHDFRKRGVRLLALTWNYENEIGYPAALNADRRLKPFGWEVVREMEKLGIAADVSHLNEGGFWDLIENAEKPPMASHSCCRALHDHSRNLTDDQLKALFARGGWVGINFYPCFLTGTTATLDDIVRQVDHMAALGGMGHMGFGSDFDGIESTPMGAEHPGCFPGICESLRSHGYDERTVMDIAGQSFLQYMTHFDGK